MIDMQVFLHLPFRARAALAIAIVEPLLGDLDPASEGYDMASNAIAMATRWVDGANVHADDLNNLLLDENDLGLFALVDYRVARQTDTAYTAIGGAISYSAWHAYRSQNLILPEGIEAMTEEFIQWIYEEASKSKSSAADFVFQFLAYLNINHRCESDCLGAPFYYYAAKSAALNSQP